MQVPRHLKHHKHHTSITGFKVSNCLEYALNMTSELPLATLPVLKMVTFAPIWHRNQCYSLMFLSILN